MSDRKIHTVSNWQALLLVVLRVAIGWHFLREGVVKLSKPGWTSAGYLRGSTGPFAPQLKALADSDGAAPLTEGDLRDTAGLVAKLSDAPDPMSEFLQFELSDDTLKLVLSWEQGKPLAEALPGKLVSDLNRIMEDQVLYNELNEDLFAKVKLTDDLKQQALARPEGRARIRVNRRLLAAAYPEHFAPVPSLLPLADGLTKWGLTLAGLGLIAGAFTRLSILGAMGFLVLFYLALPPWPETMTLRDTLAQLDHPLWTGLPQPGREGNYLYVDKNCVEFLALAVLLAFNTGRFMGLDAVFGPLLQRRRPGGREREEADQD